MAIADLAEELDKPYGAVKPVIDLMLRDNLLRMVPGKTPKTVALKAPGRRALLSGQAQAPPGVLSAGDVLVVALDEGEALPAVARERIAQDSSAAWSARLAGHFSTVVAYRSDDARGAADLRDELTSMGVRTFAAPIVELREGASARSR